MDVVALNITHTVFSDGLKVEWLAFWRPDILDERVWNGVGFVLDVKLMAEFTATIAVTDILNVK